MGFECRVVLVAFDGGVPIVDPERLRAALKWSDKLVFPCGGLSGPSVPSPSARVVSSEESSIVMMVVDFLIKRMGYGWNSNEFTSQSQGQGGKR